MKNGIRSFVLKFSIMYTGMHFLFIQAGQLQNYELEKHAKKMNKNAFVVNQIVQQIILFQFSCLKNTHTLKVYSK